jgi:hypothetical protein
VLSFDARGKVLYPYKTEGKIKSLVGRLLSSGLKVLAVHRKSDVSEQDIVYILRAEN